MSPTARLSELLGAERTGELTLAAGAPPVPAAFPRSVDELAEVLKLATRDGLAVLPLGLGSRLGDLPAPEDVDLVLSTRELSGVVAYEPGDGTLTALAGTRWSELREVARAGGHWLTPDVARPTRSTLGGVLAAGRSGFDRLRYGPMRHHVLGTRVALGDGAVTKSGGRLVKNVTGYDLHRLYCGSHGTLGLIVEASLRLFPWPRHTALLTSECDELGRALEAAQAVAAADARPTSISVHERVDGVFELNVRLDGREEAVALERAHVEPSLDAPRALEREEAERASDAARDLEPDPSTCAFLHVACRPSELAAVAPRVIERASARGASGQALLHPALATLEFPLTDVAAADQVALAVELRATLVPHRARVTLRGEGCALGPNLEAGPALALMRRLRTALDPDGRFARRFLLDDDARHGGHQA